MLFQAYFLFLWTVDFKILSGRISLFIALLQLIACSGSMDNKAGRFELVELEAADIHFSNSLSYDENFNTYTYRNFFNGAGVGVGDINNDGLIDIYLCGNQVENKLYLNQGNFKFLDITATAGVGCPDVWSTGVSMVDINGDGWLDIFVTKSGPPGGSNRHNELFINNHDLTFTESSGSYGIDDEELSNHAAFFDYDRDGDLDFYLLSNSSAPLNLSQINEGTREIRDTLGGNKLYRNDGDHFVDVSEQAGIYGSVIGFGLGVAISDVNRDGWPDIFVSNDFFERDYLYINNKNGTFSESLEASMNELSLGSMGVDAGDLNNDGFPEIYVTEMLPEDNARWKTKTVFESWGEYQKSISDGYYHQFTRNALHWNNGLKSDVDTTVFFSEVSRLTNMAATDWSWSALIFDYDNDGLNDVFVTNGIYKDLTDMDYANYYSNHPELIAQYMRDSIALIKMIDAIPSVPLPNYMFSNHGSFKFTNDSRKLGLAQAGFSNGAAYGDFDNDGDLDLIINNIDAPPFLYNNRAVPSTSHYLQLILEGDKQNKFAIGAAVTVYCGDSLFFRENYTMRGYMSSVDPKLHIGLGSFTQIDSITILWPSGKNTKLANVAANQLLIVKEADLIEAKSTVSSTTEPFFSHIPDQEILPYAHRENDFNDFNRARLLFDMVSNEGPKMSLGDINGDELIDVFIGGSKGFAASLFVQGPSGKFILQDTVLFNNDKLSEDMHSVLFDADNDGDLDLYVASGGNEFPGSSSNLRDRLYINEGRKFIKSDNIPATREGSSFVKTLDFDNDGDIDLLIGGRMVPFLYGVPANGRLLENDGKGNFEDVTSTRAPGLSKLGMLTDAVIFDYDYDNDPDVLICGAWMPLKLFQNDAGTFSDVSSKVGLGMTNGIWTTLDFGDFNNDGYLDIVAGNEGLNTRYKASVDRPLTMFINDFDRNGSIDHIIAQYEGDSLYPLALLPNLTKQIPVLKNQLPSFESYKDKTVDGIFDMKKFDNSVILKVNTLKTTVFLNKKGKEFIESSLPREAQFSRMYAILVDDINKDGNLDIIMGGNQKRIKPERGIYNGSYGLVLIGNGNGGFTFVDAMRSGIYVKGEVRDIKLIPSLQEDHLVFLLNNDSLEIFKKSQ